MICVVLYFWNCLKVLISMEIICFFIVFPYLVSFYSCGFSVQTYVRHNPFRTFKSINPCYRMIFEGCSDRCEPTYYTKTKLTKKM